MHVSFEDDQLKEIIKDVIVELMEERREEFINLLSEAIEDYLMGEAIKEGLLTKDISKEEVLETLYSLEEKS